MDYKQVKSFQDLREYLIQVRPLANNGDKVLYYKVVSKPWKHGPRPTETWVEAVIQGSVGQYKKFYGYLEDVFHNVDAGLLEPLPELLDKGGDIEYTQTLKGETP
jgi:hypothetical protein